MNARPMEWMTAGQIAAKAKHPGLVFIPVSPAFEWHSYHLPVGTDAIIAEEIAVRLATQFQACYFRALSCGLDEVRSDAFKKQQGIDPSTHVFGMNYPHLPLASEYISSTAMQSAVEARLAAVKGTGFWIAIIINHHGGCGQIPLLHKIACQWSEPSFHVESLHTLAFARFQPPPPCERFFSVGGHAGLAETLQLMAFRPDLVDLDALPEGPLSAAETGILHDGPIIPASAHPRLASTRLAQAWGLDLLNNMAQHVAACLERPAPCDEKDSLHPCVI